MVPHFKVGQKCTIPYSYPDALIPCRKYWRNSVLEYEDQFWMTLLTHGEWVPGVHRDHNEPNSSHVVMYILRFRRLYKFVSSCLYMYIILSPWIRRQNIISSNINLRIGFVWVSDPREWWGFQDTDHLSRRRCEHRPNGTDGYDRKRSSQTDDTCQWCSNKLFRSKKLVVSISSAVAGIEVYDIGREGG